MSKRPRGSIHQFVPKKQKLSRISDSERARLAYQMRLAEEIRKEQKERQLEADAAAIRKRTKRKRDEIDVTNFSADIQEQERAYQRAKIEDEKRKALERIRQQLARLRQGPEVIDLSHLEEIEERLEEYITMIQKINNGDWRANNRIRWLEHWLNKQKLNTHQRQQYETAISTRVQHGWRLFEQLKF